MDRISTLERSNSTISDSSSFRTSPSASSQDHRASTADPAKSISTEALLKLLKEKRPNEDGSLYEQRLEAAVRTIFDHSSPSHCGSFA